MKWNWQQESWPNWRFDPAALQAMEQAFLLGSGRLAGAWQHLSASHQDQLKVNLLSDEAMKSSEIEGEVLDWDSVQSSVRRQFGLQAMHRAKPAESGIADLMVACFNSRDKVLDEAMLLGWHDLVCRGRTDLLVGQYRQHAEAMQVVSGSIGHAKVHFEAPPSKDVPKEMRIFLTWLQTTTLPALTKAGLAHLYFVSIHPFEDGNGRLARAISEYVFTQSLGQPSLLALSRQIEKDRKQYYDVLEANNKRMEVTPWLIWFARTTLKAQKYSAGLIEHIIAKTHLFDLRVSARYPAPVPPFCACCRAVRFDDRGIDKQQAILAVLGQGLENTAPNPAPRPAGIAVVNRGPRAVALGQVAPRRARAQDVEYPV